MYTFVTTLTLNYFVKNSEVLSHQFQISGFTESEQQHGGGGGYMYDKMKLVGGRDTARPKPIIKNTNLVSL